MRSEQRVRSGGEWSAPRPAALEGAPQLVLYFGPRDALADTTVYDEIRGLYPDSHLVGCSTAGEIAGHEVLDDCVVVTAVHFEATTLGFSEATIEGASESEEVGRKLGTALAKDGLAHVIVFSDGLRVNGAALARGLNGVLPAGVVATGGLVGDGPRFEKTLIGLDGPPAVGRVVAVGLYGDRLRVGFGSVGGWDAFGPTRVITRSRDNVLFELDGQPALDLYKKYLGDKADGLPSTGLLFPLSVKLSEGQDLEVVRTLLAVSEEDQSMTFAGDMPEGCQVRLMRANFDHIVDGAASAATASAQRLAASDTQLVLLISCIGRKIVLQERIDEEVEAVADILGDQAQFAGFYSYGELCPAEADASRCLLHNQTMTITAFAEV